MPRRKPELIHQRTPAGWRRANRGGVLYVRTVTLVTSSELEVACHLTSQADSESFGKFVCILYPLSDTLL